MKKLFAFLSLWFVSLLSGQIFEPVELSTRYEKLDGNKIKLIVDAKIEEGWKVYATQLENLDGPIPSSLFIEDGTDYKLVGKVSESEYKTTYDEMFAMELNYHKKHAEFYQTIELKEGVEATTITAQFEFMTCDHERCLPPELIDVEWNISGENSAPSEGDKEEKSEIFDPVKWNFKYTPEGENIKVNAKATIEEGWHLYALELESFDGPIPTAFYFDGKSKLIGDIKVKDPIEAYDPNFQMDVAFYEHEVDFEFVVSATDGVAEGQVEFMVCNSERCLPPELIDFSNQEKTTGVAGESGDKLLLENLDLSNPISDCELENAVVQEKKSNWMVFFLGFIGGLLALLTPCVFPMIPMTVSFFTKGGTDKSGAGQSVLYGFFIFAIYILLSLPFHLLDSLDPEILNTISTNVYLNLFFFVIFVVFAISFFGYFEITMPSKFTNKVDSASNVGGLIGTFFMALTLALVSFSCTGPILGSLLAGSLSGDGGAFQLTMGMGGFGLALALPFALFAAFPSMMKNLPQSGGWLNTVKVVLGFIELALAIKFLSNADLVEHWGILPREIFFGFWIVIGIGLTLYLFGKIKFPHDSPIDKLSKGRIALGVFFLAFTIYLIPGLTNTEHANRRLLSGFPPPLFYSLYEQESKCPLNLPCYKNYEDGLAAAKAQNKPILLDFTGWACVNCRKMEENVWPEPEIYSILQDEVVLVSLYVDDREELPVDEQFVYTDPRGKEKKIRTIGNKWATFQTVNFKNNSQPYYAIITPDGELLTNPVGYTPDVKEYEQFLRCGIDAYKK